MTTKLYLRTAVASEVVNMAPTVNEKSSAKPVGTFLEAGSIATNLHMIPVQGPTSGGSNRVTATPASTAHLDMYVGRWCSPRLEGQTFGAGTWTFGFGASAVDIRVNGFITPTLYIWRPKTKSVVGFIYDTDTPLSSEIAAVLTTGGRVVTFTGSDVAAKGGDLLVLEVWIHSAGQDTAAARDITFYYGGGNDPTNGGSITATTCASYISTATNLVWAGGNGGGWGDRSA